MSSNKIMSTTLDPFLRMLAVTLSEYKTSSQDKLSTWLQSSSRLNCFQPRSWAVWTHCFKRLTTQCSISQVLSTVFTSISLTKTLSFLRRRSFRWSTFRESSPLYNSIKLMAKYLTWHSNVMEPPRPSLARKETSLSQSVFCNESQSPLPLR